MALGVGLGSDRFGGEFSLFGGLPGRLEHDERQGVGGEVDYAEGGCLKACGERSRQIDDIVNVWLGWKGRQKRLAREQQFGGSEVT